MNSTSSKQDLRPNPLGSGGKHAHHYSDKNLKRLLSFLEKTNAVPWEADARTWQFTYVGPQARQLLGYPVDHWYRKDFWLKHIHPEDRASAAEFCHASAQTVHDYEFEYRMIAAGKRTVWVQDIVTVERIDNVPVVLRGLLIDITDRKRTQAQAARQRHNLEYLASQSKADLTKAHQHLSALFAITSTVNASLDADSVLEKVIATITKIFNFCATRIFLVDQGSKRAELRASFEAHEDLRSRVSFFEEGQGNVGRAISTGRHLVFKDTRSDRRYLEWSHTSVSNKGKHYFFAVFPVRSKRQILGALVCVGKEPRTLSRRETDLLKAMTDHIGTAVDKIMLFQKAQEEAQSLSLLFDIGTELSTARNLPEALRRVMRRMLKAFDFDAARILLLDDATGKLATIAQVRYPGEALKRREARAHISRRVLETGRPLLFEDIDGESRYDQVAGSGLMRRYGFRAGFVLPIQLKGRTLGVISFLSKQVHRYTPREVQLISSVAAQLSIALENLNLLEKTKAQAQALQKDVLTLVKAQTSLTTAHDHLRTLTQHIQVAREEERMRIARQVHDELGQPLTVVKMALSAPTATEKARGAPIGRENEWLLGLIDDMVTTVQQIGSELRPAILDELGLVAALQWEAKAFQERTGITTKCTGTWDEAALRSVPAIEVFRIFQEVLANIYRHAHATRAAVRLKSDAKGIALIVSDNGWGIPEAQVTRPTSFGLMGMRERAHSFGAHLTIKGKAGKGTTIILQVPCSL